MFVLPSSLWGQERCWVCSGTENSIFCQRSSPKHPEYQSHSSGTCSSSCPGGPGCKWGLLEIPPACSWGRSDALQTPPSGKSVGSQSCPVVARSGLQPADHCTTNGFLGRFVGPTCWFKVEVAKDRIQEIWKLTVIVCGRLNCVVVSSRRKRKLSEESFFWVPL